ncbi:hypothetical protein DID88_005840 [Monilinia fructigena]|uniref:Splicing factor YJU2 n=1 Tax=Monilinia fructigena TaxID=38457 RepID=A0A395J214_9HELO|nr:hypothetical protein DID88_005840 [Monilinia fructigena]
MSERKVLTKYYPPDFDPSKIVRSRAPKQAGPKVQTVEKFNARKETTEEKYLAISIYRFYIKCTRCSGEITFKTDPKNMDYQCERGAKRNTEPWRVNGGGLQESDEERLDRLEREEQERDAMQELEDKTAEAKTEMAVADALDEIRTRNARNERVGKDGTEVTVARESIDSERERQEREDEEAARRAFMRRQEALEEIIEDHVDDAGVGPAPKITKEEALAMPPPSFKRVVKKKKDHAAALGIKKKPSLV